MRFAEKLLHVVRERGRTLADIASETGIPYSTLRTYAQEITGGKPDAPKGIALAKALDVSVDWLFDDDWASLPPPKYVPPPTYSVEWMFPEGVNWPEVVKAVGFWRVHQEQTDVGRAIAAEAAEGREANAKLMEEWLAVYRKRFTAQDAGDYELAGKLRDRQRQMEREHPQLERVLGELRAARRSATPPPRQLQMQADRSSSADQESPPPREIDERISDIHLSGG